MVDLTDAKEDVSPPKNAKGEDLSSTGAQDAVNKIGPISFESNQGATSTASPSPSPSAVSDKPEPRRENEFYEPQRNGQSYLLATCSSSEVQKEISPALVSSAISTRNLVVTVVSTTSIASLSLLTSSLAVSKKPETSRDPENGNSPECVDSDENYFLSEGSSFKNQGT